MSQKEVGRKEEMGYNNNIFNRRFSEKRRELYGNSVLKYQASPVFPYNSLLFSENLLLNILLF